MKTVYLPIEQRPAAPPFVAQAKQHLKAAEAMDGTSLDHNPLTGDVLVEQGDLRVTVTRDDSKGVLQKFHWVKGDDLYGTSETFVIDRLADQEIVTHQTSEPDEFNLLRRDTSSAAFSLTDGGLLYQEYDTRYDSAV